MLFCLKRDFFNISLVLEKYVWLYHVKQSPAFQWLHGVQIPKSSRCIDDCGPKRLYERWLFLVGVWDVATFVLPNIAGKDENNDCTLAQTSGAGLGYTQARIPIVPGATTLWQGSSLHAIL